MTENYQNLLKALELLEIKAQEMDKTERILSFFIPSFIRTIRDARLSIEYMTGVIKTYESAEAKAWTVPIIKDERHWYCRNCKKRIHLKKKPKFCMKCGAKIIFPREDEI